MDLQIKVIKTGTEEKPSFRATVQDFLFDLFLTYSEFSIIIDSLICLLKHSDELDFDNESLKDDFIVSLSLLHAKLVKQMNVYTVKKFIKSKTNDIDLSEVSKILL